MKWLVQGVFLGLLCLAQGRELDDARVIVAQSYQTAIVLTTSTTTVSYTCALATASNVCARRRYRRYSAIDQDKMADETPMVEGSLQEGDLVKDEDDHSDRKEGVSEDKDRDARIAFTIWSTTSSTFTVTTTSTNTATTFSLSFYCTVSGANFPPACG